jgi:hypothetical protein
MQFQRNSQHRTVHQRQCLSSQLFKRPPSKEVQGYYALVGYQFKDTSLCDVDEKSTSEQTFTGSLTATRSSGIQGLDPTTTKMITTGSFPLYFFLIPDAIPVETSISTMPTSSSQAFTSSMITIRMNFRYLEIFAQITAFTL